MIVNGEVAEPFLSACEGATQHEVGREHPVPVISRYVVLPISSQEQTAGEQPRAAFCLYHSCAYRCAVFVLVPGKR